MSKLSRSFPEGTIVKWKDQDPEKNPLLSYKLDKVIEMEVQAILEANTTRTKISHYDYVSDYKQLEQCGLVSSQETYYEHVKRFAEKLPTVGLLPSWQRNIETKISPKLLNKYAALFAEQMNETKERYRKTMFDVAVKCRTALFYEGKTDDPHEEQFLRPDKQPGRTKYYYKFLSNRAIILSNYFLWHKLIKNIISKDQSELPELIIDFHRYRTLGALDFNRFLDMVEADLKKGALSVSSAYYHDIVRLISQPRYLQDVPRSSLKDFLKCASHILAFRIMNRIMKTIEHFLTVMSDTMTAPFLKVELRCENHELFIFPLISEIFSAFYDLVNQIAKTAQRLAPLETWVGIKTNYEYMPITLPAWYLQETLEKLSCILEQTFAPMNIYVAELQEHFHVAYEPETQFKIVSFVAEGHTFEDCIARIEEYNYLNRQINGMRENEFFTIGTIKQSNAKRGLASYTQYVRQLIITELVKRHRNFNTDICHSFETIKEQLLSVPTTTQALLDMGAYMTHAATKLLTELTEKITLSLAMMASLVEYATLTKDHIELNNTTIQWLRRIRPVFEQGSAMYEQVKFEMEENLQSKVLLLNKQVEHMFPRLTIMDDMDDAMRLSEYIDDMRKFLREFDRMDEQVKWINSEEKLFNFPITPYLRITELKEIIMPYYELIYRGYQWQRHRAVWLNGPFEYIDAQVVDNKTTEYYTEISKISKQYKTKIKMQIAVEYPYTFGGSVDDPDPFQQPAPMKLCYQLLEDIKWFKQYVPLLTIFRNPALRQFHWDDMSEIAGFDLTPNAGTTFQKMIDMDLMENLEKYELISVSATKELALEETLGKLLKDWETIFFATTVYKDTGVHILTHLDDVQTLLEEHIIKVQAMRGSAFVKKIEKHVKAFYDLLLRIQATIDEWSKVQVQWMYLLPIFSSKDIVAQLPEENVLFCEVDGTFRRAMRAVEKEPRVRDTAGTIGLLEAMRESNKLMETVNEGVLNYLEKKRLYFPRFFFLSNDDMLEILSETKDPLRVQPHLRKCFEGINRLGFDKDLEIYAIISDDKEEVKMQEPISTAAARGCVERWLLQVEEQMVKSVRYETFMSYLDYESNPRQSWVLIWPGMVVLCVSQIYWSIEVQNALMTHILSAMDALVERLRSQMLDMVSLVKGQLSKQNRTTLNALITIDVHAMDVVVQLIDKKISNETDFDWLAQLRYYWEDDVFVRIIHATINYAYEYLGNCARLVITPLTDRCYRTLIGAYNLHLNGAPEGPAGTGKTETTKDLGRALAVQCVVFNCSEGLDYKSMGKFFKGLASCGAWACFDEFNRIELEVLSVVAQQILCIVQAVRGKLETFMFEGTELTLNPACYVCITMNPGYAGRSELPDNLKVLFRTVAMMVPDYAMIAEIFLYSSGFETARALSTKIVTTYKLCSEQLSTQSHYDYGMRAVKSVLTAAQNIKLKFPDEDEAILLLRSIIDVNLPKFLAHDVPLFQGIVSDLFPGVVLPTPCYDTLLKAVGIACNNRNLQPMDSFLLKIIQTFEMMIVRHGFMLVGDPLGGKTMILRVLADALTMMNEWGDENGAETVYFTLNPKSITSGQLYGCFDPVSAEWTDGICAVAFRQYCMEDTPVRKWIIFDGPVDAVWIENLNTVLDDNKKLCLTSGEIMQMSGVMSMIFEAMDLFYASPATVSRCGMIFVEPEVLGWRPMVKSWIRSLNPEWKEVAEDMVNDLFQWLMDPCLEFIRKQCRTNLYAGRIHQVKSTTTLLEMYIENAVELNLKTFDTYICPWLQAAMILAMVWGAGGALDYESRIKFDAYFLSLWRNEHEDLPLPEFIGDSLIALPEEMIHDHYYTFHGKGAWRKWQDIAKSEKFDDTGSLVHTIIPTVDTCKYQAIFHLHIKYRKRFLLYGETGTGKSIYIKDLLMNKLSQDHYLPHFITFTPKTTSWQTQELVTLKLYKRRKNQLGPLPGTHCVVFIDDVNMPAKEIYGAQPPLELLRQYFDHGNWFDLRKPEKLIIFDTMFVCAMAPPGGSRQSIYRRFLRHFNLYSIAEFSKESVTRIFVNVALIGLQRNGFTGAVIPTIQEMVNATAAIYSNASEALRPTPAKSHYLFNLRDFSRVITGCAMIKKESVESKSDFTKIWVHEILRVFGDRLIDVKDRRWLFFALKDIVQNVLKEKFESVFHNLPKFDGELTEESLQSLLFGDFMDPDATAMDRKYEEIRDMNEYRSVAINFLEEYNNTHRNKIDIVLFRYALEHLARICRILTIPCGSLLMVGVGGSGRQSLTRLASSMAGHGLFQPEIGSAYGLNEWRDDIKKVMVQSGGTGNDFVFLFAEGQIKDEAFLNDIDSILNTGEVPNLFTIEEKQEVIEMTRLAAQGGNRNLDISILTILAFFVNRCREKLHIMLCFSPIGDTFRIRLRLYPSLVNCCTIDWFEVWPEEALEQIALKSTTSINIDPDVKLKSVQACKFFHKCAKDVSERFYEQYGRKTYITTAAFLDLITTFTQLMKEKQEELSLARDRYLGGLDKLDYAAEQISQMKVTLNTLRPQLEASALATTETMKQIETENRSVAQATILVKKDEDAANVQAEVAGALKKECEADLALALPALEEAIGMNKKFTAIKIIHDLVLSRLLKEAALNTLKPADIAVVKTMKQPPEGVKLVMAAVCVMLSVAPVKMKDKSTGADFLDYWTASKRLLSDMKFLENLRLYDKDNIPESITAEIKKKYISDKNFEPKIVARASQAAEGLCKWVRAMILYDKVAKEVAPKKEKLAIAQKDFDTTMAFLAERRAMLAELNARLAVLNENLQRTLQTKIELENEVENCRNKLIRAEKLISGLGGEKGRWLAAAAMLQSLYDSLPGDILVSCGMIAYLGPFMSYFRAENMKKWKDYVKSLNIPCSEVYDFVATLGTEIKINSWNIYGLPRDSFSIENAIIMDNSKRWSLFIDPQSQANKWIRNMEKQSEVEIVKLTDKNYMRILEQSIEYGKPVLVENILETLAPPLDPILARNIYKHGGVWYIVLGEKVVEYDMRFRLYMTTKLRNPHYLPEVFNKVTLINFALTIEGLEDQLLGIVVAKERPDLQEKREYLIVQSAANKKALKQVEDNILSTLSVAGGGILEDEDAIEILDSSKILSEDILKKQEVAKKTEARIETFRQSYQPIAKHSSALYYTITDLPNIDPMYQYSLMWFINLYITSIEQANKSKVLEKRLMFLREAFTYNLYQNVCRSLFEKDKLLYSFILYTTIQLATHEITRTELMFFIQGSLVMSTSKNPASGWLPDRSWNEITNVDSLPNFNGFKDSFVSCLKDWKDLYDLLDPENALLPAPWEQKLSPFQKLIVMRMIRPDKITVKVQKYVELGMGLQFVVPPPFDISKSYSDSTYQVPLLFILSAGSDPMEALLKFADKMNYMSKFSSISLGQGQGPIAQRLIEDAQNNGTWVCLQNCHLAVSWMPTLEKLCESIDLTNTYTSFRLWLTSYPSEAFPISVLQNGVKMTNEPPTGLKKNMTRSYLAEGSREPEFFDKTPKKKKPYSKLLYALCFFHAVIQERRNYGAQGWNIKYGFNESDLQISSQQLELFIDDYDEIPFKAIRYLTGECNYGGRVTDDRDRRCLITILDDFYNWNVIEDVNYSFCDIGPEYSLPKKFEFEDYLNQIESIPLSPPPEVFGLHMNAGITRDLEVSKIFLDSLLLIQGTGAAGDTSKQDELLLSMKRDIFKELPPLFDIEEAQKVYPVTYMESMNTVLIQEVERYNNLLSEIVQSLTMLEKATQGLIVMTPEIEILATHMLVAKVPPSWTRASTYPSLKPLSSFVEDFLKRLNFFRTWLENGKPPTFWISGFSFSHAFLTAATQNFARKYKIPIDRIDFDFEVMPAYESTTPPVDGVYIYGMFLAGARWDIKNMRLAESFPKVLWEPMPIVWMKPCQVENIFPKGRYECPLYITSARFGVLKTTGHSTNYVLSILLNTNRQVSHWIKRGLALLCQLDT